MGRGRSLWEQIFSFKRSSHFEKGRVENSKENHCLIQWSPFGVCNLFSVLATPLYTYAFCEYSKQSANLCSLIRALVLSLKKMLNPFRFKERYLNTLINCLDVQAELSISWVRMLTCTFTVHLHNHYAFG